MEKAKEEAFDRIMHSANMVKEVLQRNMILSEDLVKSNQENENLRKQIYGLESEVAEVRERLEILETLTGKDANAVVEKLKNANYKGPEDGTTSEEIDDKEVLRLLSDDETADSFHRNKDKILALVYSLAKDKSILQKRVENLEKN